jgi:Tol biopolymer transport system component
MNWKILCGVYLLSCMFIVGVKTAVASTIVDLDAQLVSSATPTGPVTVHLGPGTYEVKPVGVAGGGLFDAWSAWSANLNCDVNGENCDRGFENSFEFGSASIPYSAVGDGNRYATALQALSHAQSTTFTLTVAEDVHFGLNDCVGCLSGNRGGNSLEITAIAAQNLRIRGQVVFVSDRTGNNEIFIMNADGTNQTNLTNNSADDHWGRLSPDGTKILFRSTRANGSQVWVMNSDGSNPTNLTGSSGGDQPTWSPDGTKIAFVRSSQVFIMNADGTGASQLTSAGGFDPVWSPDGAKIAYTSTQDRPSGQIYVINVDGSGITRLTNHISYDQQPSWSPDGTKIAFYSHRDNDNDEIFVMNADGTNPINLTNAPSSGEYGPSWSPDGTKIAFSSSRNGNSEIYVMNEDGSNQTRITNIPGTDQAAYWEKFYRIGSTASASVSRIITIENTGGTSLVVSNIIASNGAFSVNPTSFNVGGGSSQAVTVTYTPNSTGTSYSTLTITSNDASSPTVSLMVNATGAAIETAAPDTIATYDQPISIPVRVSDTTGQDVVAGEVSLVFDGDLLTVSSVSTSGTLMAGWTLQTNVTEGNGTSIDTLKVAAAHTTALAGSGALFNVVFQVADVRMPASSPLALSHVLFNAGNLAIDATDGSLTLVGNDAAISSTPTIIPRESIAVTVTDLDLNTDESTIQTASVFVVNGAQTEGLTVSETSVNSSVFTGVISTVFSASSTAALHSNDGFVQAKAGDAIQLQFQDALDGNGNGLTLLFVVTTAIGGFDGSVQITNATQPGDVIYIEVIDADLNTSSGVQQTVQVVVSNTNGESETVTLTEVDTDDEVFFGSLNSASGASAGTNNDGTVNGAKGNVLTVSYDDVVTALGDQLNRTDTDQVVNPFGDADGNGLVQAFDAAKVLLHVLSPSLTGLELIQANVDLDPIGTDITPFDASLILQKRVGLIAIFPVQTAPSTNHPQPLASSPKWLVERRVLSLAAGEGYLSLVADERTSLLSGDLLLAGVEHVELASELGTYLIAVHRDADGLRVVFAGPQGVEGAGEVLRLYGADLSQVRLQRAELNDGQIEVLIGEDDQLMPPRVTLLQGNWPNPFNPETTIRFELAQAGAVQLEVFDALGQKVKTLVSASMPAGVHQVLWHGLNDSDRQVSSGVYFYRLQTGGYSKMQRMLLLK